MPDPKNGSHRFHELLDELESLLKNPTTAVELAQRGVNTSLALVALQGVRAYLDGDKARAADDLETVAEEVRHRMNP